MDTISSSEFRKSFASLKRPTVVTVHGHLIGRWMPGAPAVDAVDVGGEKETRPAGLRPADLHPRLRGTAVDPARRPFAEFRPVPKSGKKG